MYVSRTSQIFSFRFFGLKNILLGLKSEVPKSTRVLACPRLRLGLVNLTRVDFRASQQKYR